MTLSPIVLFVYNRPEHTKRTIASLRKNIHAAGSHLYIYADGPRDPSQAEAVGQVRNYLREIDGFRKVTLIEREQNYGLARNIIDGVTTLVNEWGRIIVLEDDMIVSPHFLEFMNEALEKYEHTAEVISIHGYNLPINYPEPVFFLRGADCWGWATWRRGWQYFNTDSTALMQELKKRKLQYDFDFDGSYNYTAMLQQQIEGKVNSWAIRWYASAYLNNMLTLYPAHSLVQNIGADDGTHGHNAEQYQTTLNSQKIVLPDIPVAESRLARKLIGQYHFRYQSFKNKLKKILKWGY